MLDKLEELCSATLLLNNKVACLTSQAAYLLSSRTTKWIARYKLSLFLGNFSLCRLLWLVNCLFTCQLLICVLWFVDRVLNASKKALLIIVIICVTRSQKKFVWRLFADGNLTVD